MYTLVIVVNAGKYPHLMVACDGVTFNSPQLELLVNFGSVPVGLSAEKWIEILNLSPVCMLRTIALVSSTYVSKAYVSR